ncbi:MAG: hypothetical protein AB7Q00_16245 [Phycisphaerales bacterium]
MTLPAHGYNLADGETFRVKVFRDHPEWDRHKKWWMMPAPLLKELFVCAYDCDGTNQQMEWIENAHPDCVFVY